MGWIWAVHRQPGGPCQTAPANGGSPVPPVRGTPQQTKSGDSQAGRAGGDQHFVGQSGWVQTRVSTGVLSWPSLQFITWQVLPLHCVEQVLAVQVFFRAAASDEAAEKAIAITATTPARSKFDMTFMTPHPLQNHRRTVSHGGTPAHNGQRPDWAERGRQHAWSGRDFFGKRCHLPK